MKICKNCYVDLEETDKICPCCGVKLIDKAMMEQMVKDKRHGVIRSLSSILKIFAVILLIGALYFAMHSTGIQTLYVIGGGIFSVVVLWTFAEMEKVVIDTEENTRDIVDLKTKARS